MARHYERRKKRALMSEMNVVPYIDVMLVLLVIFMITAPLLTTGVEIDLPNSSAKPVEPVQQSDPLVLSINDIGEWYVNLNDQPDQAVEKETALRLAAAALEEDPNRPVRVAADETINYGSVMEAMVTLQAAGADKVQLMSDPPQ
ncbi:protein TolR [Chromatiales bacterium (ex Bugula neritina AB1)]|nr:protein TolR [Chromatiales bacterium (ex Bugula neritina AB1)]